MKKLLGLLLVVLTLSSCVSTSDVVSPEFDISINSEKGLNLVDMSVDVNWRKSDFWSGLEEGVSGFQFSIANNTDKIVKLVWEQSSINYGDISRTIFIEGQKYADSEIPMAPTVIAAKGNIKKGIYSSSQPKYRSGKYGGWEMNRINAAKFTIVICVQSGDMEDYYTINVTKKTL